MANFFSSLFGGAGADVNSNVSGLLNALGPSFMNEDLTDPLKTAVANPLSSYLSSQIGQGLPSYQGQLVAPLPNGGGSAVEPLLNMTSQQLINQTNAAAENEFKNSFAANVEEGSAGALSGSGAGQQANQSETALQLGLAQQDVGIEESLPTTQIGLAQAISSNQTQQDQAEYQNWYTSLAQNNPALSNALSFLNNSTSSGTTVESAVNPGILGSLINAGAELAASGG